MGCQTTQEKPVESSPSFKIKEYTPEPITVRDMEQFIAPSIPIKEQNLTQPSIDQFTNRKSTLISQDKAKQKKSPLLNQQACRDNVKVSYSVVDQNAVSGIFNAKAQVQAVILSLSQDQKYLKLRTTGWFSTNENLQRWQPYLKKPPRAKDILLKVGAEFWDSQTNWYLCGVN
ncbi:MAG: hypothetical protein ACSHW0_05165 [Thalassotalea sp.]